MRVTLPEEVSQRGVGGRALQGMAGLLLEEYRAQLPEAADRPHGRLLGPICPIYARSADGAAYRPPSAPRFMRGDLAGVVSWAVPSAPA